MCSSIDTLKEPPEHPESDPQIWPRNVILEVPLPPLSKNYPP